MRLVIVMAALLLVACQQPAEESAPEPHAAGHLGSSAYYLERIVMPEGSHLEVLLVDVSGGSERIISRAEVDEATAPPFEFVLDYPADTVTAGGEHELWLTLYLPDGHARFAAEKPVDLRESGVDAIRLVALEPMAETAMPGQQSWQCGDILLDAEHGEEQVILTLPWGDVMLEQVTSASGIHYLGESGEFRVRGNREATLTLAGEETIQCQPSDRRSVWALAREQGVSLRAVGNEPGWVFELTGGEEPLLFLVLDNGEHELDFVDVEMLEDGSGLFAEGPGNIVEAAFIEEPCVDTMVGWEFPVRVEMAINETALEACGRYLDD